MKKKSFIFGLLALMTLVSCGENSSSNSEQTNVPSIPNVSTNIPTSKDTSVDSPSNNTEPSVVAPSVTEPSVVPPSVNEPSFVTPSVPSTISSSENNSSSTSIAKLTFDNAKFDDVTIGYDGEQHKLADVYGIPEGTKVTYNGRNSYIDTGTYAATAILEKENYETKSLKATLTILPADFANLEYKSVSVTYDGKDHVKDVKLVGFIPEGTKTTETIKDSNGKTITSAVEVGVYNYTIEISNKNYNKISLSATLTINKAKKDMPVFVAGDGTTYFANGLNNNYLYSFNDVNGIKRIDFSSPKEFNKHDSNSVIYIANSLLSNSVKQVENGEAKPLYTGGNIDDFVKYNDNVYYYSSNPMLSSEHGIYKVVVDENDEEVVSKVFDGKTDNLAIYNNYLYFTNGNDNNYIYKMNLNNNTTSLVLSEKVHEYIIENNKLYCVVNGLLNDYIGFVNLNSTITEPTKLTNSAGEFLTIKNNKLYYNYTDLFGKIDSSKLGIWSININNKEETQVLKIDGVNGFDADDSNSLYYIDSNDLHLYSYDISSKTKIDLLKDFVIPESTPYNLGGKTVAHGTRIYYLNMYAGKTLYAYDENDKKNYQLTANKVMDYFIYNDVLYFNQVTRIVNNDIYCVNLNTNSEATKVSSNDVRNMICDGEYIYGTHYNWAGTAGGISRMKMDGTEYIKFSDIDGAKNLSIKDEKLYFINCGTGQDNGNIEYIPLSSITETSTKITSTNLSKTVKNVKQFIIDGNDLFYIYNGTFDNSIRRTSFNDFSKETKIASSKTNPNEILLYNGYIYYYSYAVTALSSAGFYKVNKNATGDNTQELILGYNEQYYGSDFVITDSGYWYFLNYIPKLMLGDAHTYQLNLTSKKVTKLD